jgi:hypothetical protein
MASGNGHLLLNPLILPTEMNPNEPNGGTTEDWLMTDDFRNGTWNDFRCTSAIRLICKCKYV